MLIPPLNQLRVEDFPKDQQQWLAKLLLPLNQFLTATTRALNGQLTFTDNFVSQRKTLSFVYTSTTLPLSISTTVSNPQDVRVISATVGATTGVSASGTPTAVVCTWQLTNTNTISITALHTISNGTVAALVSGTSYSLTFQITA